MPKNSPKQRYGTDDNPPEKDGYGDLALVGPTDTPEECTAEERAAAIAAGNEFAAAVMHESGGQPAPCLAIVGQFPPLGSEQKLTDLRVLESCLDVFGYPRDPRDVINILLDSPGGSLDSAFKIVRYLSCYASELNVYVPRRAKSASTLLALGANRVYMSRFGELGPLDTQIFDPRNPVAYVSALDCYQSVDHVRKFGIDTMSEALRQLSKDAGVQVPLTDLLDTASMFATGAIEPIQRGIRALDFGAWGRSLKIGEKYAQILLRDHYAKEAESIAARLVYNYTHHLFPIDYREAQEIGLNVGPMSEDLYRTSLKVLKACGEKVFVGFISPTEEKKQTEAEAVRRWFLDANEPAPAGTDGLRPAPDEDKEEGHPNSDSAELSGQSG